MSALADSVISTTVRVIEGSCERISTCASYRISCEGWMKVELVHQLGQTLKGTAIVRPELEHVDIVVESLQPSDGRALLQLKTFPTNYGASGKPITNFIEGVIDDLRKLKEKRRPQDVGLAIWLAYPIPAPVPPQWPRHVERVRAAAASQLHEQAHPICAGSAKLYVMQSM